MIELQVEEYCTNCPDFKAEQNSETVIIGFDESECYHTITCKNKEKCKAMMQRLKQLNDSK